MIELMGMAIAPKKPKGFVVLEPAVLPNAVNAAMACVHGNNLYFAGGINSSTTFTTFRRFNLLTRTWTSLAVLPKPLEGGVLSAIGDNIYLFGGAVMSGGAITSYSADLYKYDIANNSWVLLSTSPLGGRRLFPGGVIGNKLYYFGGWNGTQLARVESYDVTTNTWTTLPNLPGIRHGHCAVSDGQKIYIFAGLTNGGGSVMNDVLVFDPSVSQTAVALAVTGTLPTVRCYSGVCVDKGILYIYGGFSDGNGGGTRNDASYLDLTTKVWQKLNLTGYAAAGRAAPAYTYWNGEFHLLGGVTANAASRFTEHIYIVLDQE